MADGEDACGIDAVARLHVVEDVAHELHVVDTGAEEVAAGVGRAEETLAVGVDRALGVRDEEAVCVRQRVEAEVRLDARGIACVSVECDDEGHGHAAVVPVRDLEQIHATIDRLSRCAGACGARATSAARAASKPGDEEQEGEPKRGRGAHSWAVALTGPDAPSFGVAPERRGRAAAGRIPVRG